MSELGACVVVGPTREDSSTPRHVSVMGQYLTWDEGAWIFTSIPTDLQAIVATFRLTADGVGPADVVRVGTALALYTEPSIGEVGGEILDHLGSEETYDVRVTPELARFARPITSWALSTVLTAGPDMRQVATDLAIGAWSVRFAELSTDHVAPAAG